MNGLNYKKYNVILGWVSFAIALITYSSTLEPTVSFWDCGEFISTSTKLEVGHPPGAPLFQMLGAFFAIFAVNKSDIAIMVNFMSALASAFTILFLFWSISNFAKRMIVKKDEEVEGSQIIAILGSALVGALAYTFSDSFWFSAVEGEVYAMSSFLMALLLWLALKWEQEMDKPRGHKWLLLISLIVGLSFGVHILTLLVIPSVVFIYIFKQYGNKLTTKSFVIANIVAILILVFVFKFLFPFTLKFFSDLELFFVNTVGMPFNSGSIIAFILLVTAFYFGIKYTRKKGMVHVNILILSIMFIMIGFSSWLMLPIRANADTTINENNPSSARELLAYYNREQYGDANVFYDNFYTTLYDRSLDESNPYIDDKPKYEKDKKLGKYSIVNKKEYKKSIPNYGNEQKGFIPRMVDSRPSVIDRYIKITGELPKFKLKPKSEIDPYYQKYYKQIKQQYEGFMDAYLDGKVKSSDYMKYLNENQEFVNVQKPSFFSNLKFMMSYQFGYMYGRYFMWNFVGKQNDIQGQLDMNGNWLSGINFIDNAFLVSQDNLPKEMLENKGRNTYFFLPFILGVIGFFFHIKKDINIFYTLLLFFLFTGLAVVFYTNPKPFEPRERDYAVVGSFYVFAIWIGLGVLALYEAFRRFVPKKITAITVSVICLFAVPLLMANQNWDDHDRSGRYTALLNAKAYLDSCQENAIMFTIGDNDSFPLWYMQEVEGYRTDVKLINTSLFATDWYIDQQKRKTYKANPIPSSLTHNQYRTGSLDVAYHVPKNVSAVAVKEDVSKEVKTDTLDKAPKEQRVYLDFLMSWISSKEKQTYEDVRGNNHLEKTYPTNKVRVPVDKQAVLKNGIVRPEDAHLIVDHIDMDVDENGLTKNRILMLDILANNHWKRPIYFTGGAFADEEYLWMKDYLQLDGMAYKLVPIKTKSEEGSPMDLGRINTTVMYEYFKKFDWKNSNNPNVYMDPESKKNSLSYRNNLNRLAEAFIAEKDFDKAEEMMDLSVEKLPMKMYGHYSLWLGVIDNYYKIGKKEKAKAVAQEMVTMFKDNLLYYNTLDYYDSKSYYDDIGTDLLMYGNIVESATEYDKAFADELITDAMNNIPFRMYRTESLALSAIKSYYKLDKPEKAKELSRRLVGSYTKKLTKFANAVKENKDHLTNEEVIKQFDVITPEIDFYKYVRNENKGKDSIFEKELEKGFNDAFKKLEKAMD